MLVIDNYDSFVYNVIQLLREAVVPVGYDIVRNDKIDFSGLGDYGGILLSPGPGIPAEAGELLKLIEFCKYTHPILGICLGHQAIWQRHSELRYIIYLAHFAWTSQCFEEGR